MQLVDARFHSFARDTRLHRLTGWRATWPASWLSSCCLTGLGGWLAVLLGNCRNGWLAGLLSGWMADRIADWLPGWACSAKQGSLYRWGGHQGAGGGARTAEAHRPRRPGARGRPRGCRGAGGTCITRRLLLFAYYIWQADSRMLHIVYCLLLIACCSFLST